MNCRMETVGIEVIEKKELSRYRELILPYIYEELLGASGDLARDYICLGGVTEEKEESRPVSALILLREQNGDLAILSLYTLKEWRRQGIASGLLEKAVFAARQLFVFEDEEDECFINLKAVYRLSEPFKNVWEEFLKKNDFTDFYLLKEEGELQVWAAIGELRFYRKYTGAEEDAYVQL